MMYVMSETRQVPLSRGFLLTTQIGQFLSSDEGVTLETSALKLFTAANLRYLLS